MKILITGGLGFLGSNLAHKLVDGPNEVIILTKSTNKLFNIAEIKDRVKIILRDIKNIGDAVKGMDIIYHFAGYTDNYGILENPYVDIQSNCVGTVSLLEACREYNPNVRIVFGSTFFVVGKPHSNPVNEYTPCNPVSLYGATRLAAEHFCRVYNNVFNMNVVIVRFTNIFGIREQMANKKKAGFNYLIAQALRDEEISMYGKGDVRRDYLYISDAVNACIVVAMRGISGEVYFIGSGKGTSLHQLLQNVIEIAGTGKIGSVPPSELHKKIGINDFWCDIRKVQELGWEPKVSIHEGVEKTIHFYKELKNWNNYMGEVF